MSTRGDNYLREADKLDAAIAAGAAYIRVCPSNDSVVSEVQTALTNLSLTHSVVDSWVVIHTGEAGSTVYVPVEVSSPDESITDVRLFNGAIQVKRGSGNWETTVPDTICHLLMNGTDASTVFVDSSTNGYAITVGGDAVLDTAQKSSGTASAYFQAGGYLSIADDSTWDIGTGNFSLECDFRISALPTGGGGSYLMSKGGTGGFLLQLLSDVSNNVWLNVHVGGTQISTGIRSWSLNTWYNARVMRISGVVYLFLDDSQINLGEAAAGDVDTSSAFLVGDDGGLTNVFLGWIDNVKVSRIATDTLPTVQAADVYMPDWGETPPYDATVTAGTTEPEWTGACVTLTGLEGVQWSIDRAGSANTRQFNGMRMYGIHVFKDADYSATTNDRWGLQFVCDVTSNVWLGYKYYDLHTPLGTYTRQEGGSATPATIDVVAAKNTLFLFHMEGSDASTTFTNSSDYTLQPTAVGDAQIDTAQFFLGSASALFDGTGDYVQITHEDIFDIGTGDFTIEGMVRFAALPTNGNSMALFQMGGNTSVGVSNTAGQYKFDMQVATNVYSYNISPSLDTWYYWAIKRSSGVCTAFFGSQLGTQAEAGSITGNDNIALGDVVGGGAGLNGWLDEVRFSRVARTLAQPSTQYVAD